MKSLNLFVLLIFLILSSTAKDCPPNEPPPNCYQLGTLDPQGPNASCMTREEIATAYPYDWSDCSGLVPYDSIYVDANQDRRNTIMETLYIYSTASAQSCQEVSLILTCQVRFRPCGTYNGSIYAVPICRYWCSVWIKDCIFYYNGSPADQVFNCSMPDPVLFDNFTYPMFPTGDDYEVTLYQNFSNPTAGNMSVTLGCFLDKNITVDTSRYCPSQLHQNGQSCDFNCPFPYVSEYDYNVLELIMDVFGWVSFILTYYLIISFTIFQEKRQFPGVLPVFLFICANIRAFAYCFGSMIGHENIWCQNNHTPNSWGAGACTFQGIIWVYSTLTGMIWWTIICFNLALITLFPSWQTFIKRWYHVYHLAWFPAVITLIIALANEVLGYGGDVWCSIHIGPVQVEYTQDVNGAHTYASTDEYLWNLLLLIVPIFVMLIIGTICFVGFTVKLLLYARAKKWKIFFIHTRISIFILYYIIEYSLVFAFEVSLITQKNSQLQNYQNYIICSYDALFNKTLVCELADGVNFGLWVVIVLFVASEGIVLFVIFGTSLGLYKLWYKLFANLFRGNVKEAFFGSIYTTKKLSISDTDVNADDLEPIEELQSPRVPPIDINAVDAKSDTTDVSDTDKSSSSEE